MPRKNKKSILDRKVQFTQLSPRWRRISKRVMYLGVALIIIGFAVGIVGIVIDYYYMVLFMALSVWFGGLLTIIGYSGSTGAVLIGVLKFSRLTMKITKGINKDKIREEEKYLSFRYRLLLCLIISLIILIPLILFALIPMIMG